ncbi:MAG: hypothetical protein M3164_06460 [Actinomycetota bacterium]|nr:hypothetical protein [Actinomycetota bacterium]
MSFRLIFELEPPRKPDLSRVHRQVEIFGPITDAILVPDNHLGLPAISSVAIALEIRKAGFKPIVSINARDRNLLRLESDLVTLLAYGIDEVLFLYGDQVKEGRSTLNVRKMLAVTETLPLAKGVLASPGQPLGWRSKADFLLTKLDFGRAEVGPWKRSLEADKPVYCGVLALPDVGMAEKILANIPDLTLPEGYLSLLQEDEDYGFKAAIDELDHLCSAGMNGAQLVVPANRRRFAELLAEWSSSRKASP